MKKDKLTRHEYQQIMVDVIKARDTLRECWLKLAENLRTSDPALRRLRAVDDKLFCVQLDIESAWGRKYPNETP